MRFVAGLAALALAGCGGSPGTSDTTQDGTSGVPDGGASADPHLQCIAPADAGPVFHCNGIANGWSDSVPLFTFSETQAMKACAAYTGRLGACVPIADCAGLGRGIIQSDNVFSWVYSGQDTGRVLQQMEGPTSCGVAMSEWN